MNYSKLRQALNEEKVAISQQKPGKNNSLIQALRSICATHRSLYMDYTPILYKLLLCLNVGLLNFLTHFFSKKKDYPEGTPHTIVICVQAFDDKPFLQQLLPADKLNSYK
jgi:hypothetical protein